MTRIPTFAAALAALALSACVQPVPDSGSQGWRFETPEAAALRRDAQLAGTIPLQPYGANDPSEAEMLASETLTALGRPAGGGFDPIAAPGPVTPVTLSTIPADLDLDNPAISQEQSFEAVSQERDIAADAERLRQARAQYQVVQPTELERPADVGPNIFDYALNRSQPLGSSDTYGRGLRASADRAASKCAPYSSPDLAQKAFLEAGGPDRDKLGLDPDGDGNACNWDPAVVRRLVQQ